MLIDILYIDQQLLLTCQPTQLFDELKDNVLIDIFKQDLDKSVFVVSKQPMHWSTLTFVQYVQRLCFWLFWEV